MAVSSLAIGQDVITSSNPALAGGTMVPGPYGGSPEIVRIYGEVRGVAAGTSDPPGAERGQGDEDAVQ